jgi:Nuclease-related domain
MGATGGSVVDVVVVLDVVVAWRVAWADDGGAGAPLRRPQPAAASGTTRAARSSLVVAAGGLPITGTTVARTDPARPFTTRGAPMIDQADAPRGIELGHPGASARAEFERRRRRDASARRRRFGRVLAPVVALVTGIRPSTARWRVGGEAEERVGRLLSSAVGDAGVVLHDRAVPRGRANVDHIAIVPSGVWVIDTKRYRGRVRRAGRLGRLVGRRILVVNGHDRSHLLDAARRQRALVASAAGQATTVRAALCFADAEWGLWARPFALRGVTVTWPGALAAALVARAPRPRRAVGPLGPARPRLSSLQRSWRFPAAGEGRTRPAVTEPRFAGHARRH